MPAPTTAKPTAIVLPSRDTAGHHTRHATTSTEITSTEITSTEITSTEPLTGGTP